MSSEHRHAEEERPVAAFRSTQLFGGALIVDLPSTFADVRYVAQCVALIFWLIKTSTLRQVPDSQEVYLDKEGYTSIIFDLTRSCGPTWQHRRHRRCSTHHPSGRDCRLRYRDSESLEYDSHTVFKATVSHRLVSLHQGFMPRSRAYRHSEDIPAYTLIATQTPHPDPESKTPAPDFTAIVLSLIRLEKQFTDILITINVPHIKGEYDEEEVDLQLGKQGKMIEDAVEYAAKIWETFDIKDWNLFNEI